jgi:transcriptional regulator with XRE-family HTH domain
MVGKSHGPQLTGSQCRLARKLLGWSQGDLAVASGVDVGTVSAFERDSREPWTVTVHSLYDALQNSPLPREDVATPSRMVCNEEGRCWNRAENPAAEILGGAIQGIEGRSVRTSWP